MDIRKLQRAIVDGLEDVKAQDILVFNTEHLSALFERVIIATGASNRQTKALASSVREAVKGADFPVLATEGGDNGEWIIVDCGAAVVHLMQPAIREYYRLEEIWGGKPVRIKLGGDTRKGLVKASEGDDDEDDDSPPMSATRKAAAKKVAAKTAARKTPAESAPARQAVAQKAPAKKVAAKTAAVKTPARKRVAPVGPVSQTLVVKPVARKTAATAGAKSGGRPAAKRAPAKKAPAARKTAPRR